MVGKRFYLNNNDFCSNVDVDLYLSLSLLSIGIFFLIKQ